MQHAHVPEEDRSSGSGSMTTGSVSSECRRLRALRLDALRAALRCCASALYVCMRVS